MKMKRVFIYVVAMFFILCAQAQEARHYFTSMPDSVLPLLTAVNRADCIDFLDSHMRAEQFKILWVHQPDFSNIGHI